MKGRQFKDTVFEMVARMARAFAAPKRLEILDVLAQGERDVDGLARQISASVANTSRHLQVLKQAHLVTCERSGVRMIYKLASPSVLDSHLALRGLAKERLVEMQAVVRDFFEERDGLEPISRKEFIRRFAEGDLVVVDTRPEEEFAAGHIPGAMSVPPGQLEKVMGKLSPDQEVVAYCRGPYCVLSATAVARLREQGFRATRLEDGFPEWRRSGLPVETVGVGGG